MPSLSTALTKEKLCIDFAALKHACPKGVYVAPVPANPLLWVGVIFVRKGPYVNAILRFRIDFPPAYPEYPPTVTLLTDVFHPLVAPLTTYTYAARDNSAETISAANEDRLPPGGLSLRFGFPGWTAADASNKGPTRAQARDASRRRSPAASTPLTVELLHYLRIVFDTEAMLDTIPQEAAANEGAWHAWRSYRSKLSAGRSAPPSNSPWLTEARERSSSPVQQPGGARSPAEWNWQGVWEDRVKRSIQASISDHALYGSEHDDVIAFSHVDQETMKELLPGGQGPEHAVT